ncbi:transmembrane protein 70 homolog, mitochondrial isoform X1 [Cephus cinctus]|uniref:Transmembrane protein 70 homolog, mitochondrial isoform X1 n=1 Tax=Cephus cinctus TaxID=211228 RepID=A0AAJ7BVI6_CEPCN|nr:transmembrane protein 70 homolog, mitochondrial isoform X1 [Cephus cinctus]
MAFISRACSLRKGLISLFEWKDLNCNIYSISRKSYNVEVCGVLRHRKYFSIQADTNHNTQGNVEQIYYGTLSTQIRNIKLFSLVTSISSISVQPLLIQRVAESDSIATTIGVCAFVGFFAFVTPLLLHIVTKRYITHLYYDNDRKKYIAITYTLFLQKKKTEFTPDDVYVPDITGMFTTCLINKKPFFFDMRFFSDMGHYKKIMGYDKPIDFKLGTLESDKSPESIKK